MRCQSKSKNFTLTANEIGFVRLICLAAAWLFITNSASAQAYRQLTAYDFQGVPHPEQGKIAYTNCSIYFHYEAHRERTYYRLNFDIRLIMNNYKSWMDKQHVTTNEMLAEVLKHEQAIMPSRLWSNRSFCARWAKPFFMPITSMWPKASSTGLTPNTGS